MMKKLSNVVGVVLLILAILGWDEIMDGAKKQYKWTKEHQAFKDGRQPEGLEFLDKYLLDETEKPEATETPEVRKTPEVTEAPEYEEKNTDNGTLLDIHPDEYYSDGYDDKQDEEKCESYEYDKDAIKAVPKEIRELTTDTEIFDKLIGSSRCTEDYSDLRKEAPFTNVCVENARFNHINEYDDGSIVIVAEYDSVNDFGVYSTDYIDFHINKDIIDSMDFSNLNTEIFNQPLDLYGFKCSYVKDHEHPIRGHIFMEGYNFVAK